MNRVGIVVQRWHESIVGGSEALAWQYASLLSDAYEVDVLTTTALNISDWANVLPEGVTQTNGVNVHRFSVTIGRSPYWQQIYDRMVAACDPFAPGPTSDSGNVLQKRWTLALQEEFIKHQGPYSVPLLQYLKQNWSDYRALIFVTYLYPTSYFGLQQIPAQQALFVPTLHDELPAHLPAFRYAAHRAHRTLWLTDAERRVGERLWGNLPGDVISAAIDSTRYDPPPPTSRYLLYCGRVDPNKGCKQLFDYFIKFKRTFPTRLRLVITGKDDMRVPGHSDIEFRGFVSPEEKASLMAGATAYVMPSPNESFSFVTLEAMAQGTPVLARNRSGVLVDHVNRSGAGLLYDDYESFAAQLRKLLNDTTKNSEMGIRGQQYAAGFNNQTVRDNLIKAIEETHEEKQRRKTLRSAQWTREEFAARFEHNLATCEWLPDPVYSVFTQFDQEYYLSQHDSFLHKYKCFYAVAKTIAPSSMIELGTCAGSSADAYLSGAENPRYIGIDVFGVQARHDNGERWAPIEVASALLKSRGFSNWRLINKDLRQIEQLPETVDLVVVDAAHDFENEYADLHLALTAKPVFIFVDDADDPDGALPCIRKFVEEDLAGRVEYTYHIPYIGGGMVIKLK